MLSFGMLFPMEKLKARLKPGKEKPLLNRHHWIFSGALADLPPFEPGGILPVESSQGVLLGHAYFNKASSIIGRMIAFGDEEPLEALSRLIKNAILFRKSLFDGKTTAYRLINGEGDSLPGLIVDVYGDVLVLQISTLGMDKLKSHVLKTLQEELRPQAILEKSLLPSRKEEGMAPFQGMLFGKIPEPLIVLEKGLQFQVDPEKGQKTGFFLDQREMRSYVRTISKGKRVLNVFAYTGGFTVYAFAGGASSVDSVDISKEAIEMARENSSLNGFKGNFYAEDAFKFLRSSSLDYDLVILDPPAFAKRAKDVVQACRGYKDINRVALQKMPPGSTLITCSCSHFIDEKLFQQVLFQAAAEAKRSLRIMGKHQLASDHPINLFHPEGSYLKSLVLYLS
jgi:23S rRNA (cytosine1962-C5)-methyltransferase